METPGGPPQLPNSTQLATECTAACVIASEDAPGLLDPELCQVVAADGTAAVVCALQALKDRGRVLGWLNPDGTPMYPPYLQHNGSI
jgi:hypothetical protein